MTINYFLITIRNLIHKAEIFKEHHGQALATNRERRQIHLFIAPHNLAHFVSGELFQCERIVGARRKQKFKVLLGSVICDQEVQSLDDLLCVGAKVSDFLPVAQIGEEVGAKGQEQRNDRQEVPAAFNDIPAEGQRPQVVEHFDIEIAAVFFEINQIRDEIPSGLWIFDITIVVDERVAHVLVNLRQLRSELVRLQEFHDERKVGVVGRQELLEQQ